MAHPIAAQDVEALLGSIFEHSPDPVGLSEGAIIRMVNPALVELFRYESADDLIGRSFLDLMAPEEMPALSADVRSRAEGGTVPGHYTPWAVRADGTRFRMEVRTTAFVRDGVRFTLALARDLGEDRRSAEELYDAIFARNTAVKLLIDPGGGEIVDANAAAVQFYGWSAAELRSMRIADINTLTSDQVADEMESARTGQRGYFRFRHRIASGEVRHVDVHSGPVSVAGRELLLSIVQDTTERAAFEERLRNAHKLEAVGRLAGGVAHDFNNLLTIILTSAELVGETLDPASRERRLLADLADAGRRASELTGRLLAVGQRQQLLPEIVDLADVVRGMERLLQGAIGDSVELVLELQANLTVEADAGQLDRVLTNLVLNASQAIDGAGTIRVDVQAAADSRWVELIVTDDGRGMDNATQSRVFEPFFTTRRVGGGTGLGLASAYGIVTQSGGTLEVESSPGEGAVFTIRLPLASRRSDSKPLSPGRVPTVLLVEDETGLRDLLAQGLRASGFAVVALGDGAAALRLTDEEFESVDVLVTDQTMPGATGLEVAEGLRGRRPGLPIVLISGNLGRGDQERLPVGSMFLAKPFSRAQLSGAIRAVLQRAAVR